MATETKTLTLYYEKINNSWWSETYKGEVRMVDEIKGVEVEKIGEIKDTRYEGKGYSFWKDTKTGELLLCREPDSEWWKKYDGTIEELQKLTVEEIGNIFTKEIEKNNGNN
jgi:hypothetical protein